MLPAIITPGFIVLAAVGGAVSTAAGIAVRHLWKRVTHLEAQVDVHGTLLNDGSNKPDTQV